MSKDVSHPESDLPVETVDLDRSTESGTIPEDSEGTEPQEPNEVPLPPESLPDQTSQVELTLEVVQRTAEGEVDGMECTVSNGTEPVTMVITEDMSQLSTADNSSLLEVTSSIISPLGVSSEVEVITSAPDFLVEQQASTSSLTPNASCSPRSIGGKKGILAPGAPDPFLTADWKDKLSPWMQITADLVSRGVSPRIDPTPIHKICTCPLVRMSRDVSKPEMWLD